MTILVSPAERPPFDALGPASSVVEEYGCDFLAYGAERPGTEQARGFIVGVQRKTFPGDFLSSIRDGRFATLLPKIVQADMRLLVLEGQPRWTTSGALMNYDYGRAKEFRRSHLRSMLLSLEWVWGVNTVWTDDPLDTVEFLKGLDGWATKDHHEALGVRPGAPVQFKGREPKKRDLAVHFLQGVRGWGPEVARRVFDEFERVPLSLSPGDAERLLSVEGVGEKRLEALRRLVE